MSADFISPLTLRTRARPTADFLGQWGKGVGVSWHWGLCFYFLPSLWGWREKISHPGSRQLGHNCCNAFGGEIKCLTVTLLGGDSWELCSILCRPPSVCFSFGWFCLISFCCKESCLWATEKQTEATNSQGLSAWLWNLGNGNSYFLTKSWRWFWHIHKLNRHWQGWDAWSHCRLPDL